MSKKRHQVGLVAVSTTFTIHQYLLALNPPRPHICTYILHDTMQDCSKWNKNKLEGKKKKKKNKDKKRYEPKKTKRNKMTTSHSTKQKRKENFLIV
jgi:flagellar biosynthesis component FlhA